ncbi:MAG: BamA/TamA family outer membrane protein [Sphingomonas sp.]|nr:BamA/TamA family outer membrane protein [Sphingomonas sp.]
MPAVAHAQISPGGQPGQGAPASSPTPPQDASPDPAVADEKPIIPDAEFEAQMPQVTGDLDAPLAPLPENTAPVAADASSKAVAEHIEALAPVPEQEPELAAPLPPLSAFDVTAQPTDAAETDDKTVVIRYTTLLQGLDELGLDDEFRGLSALEKGKGKAANAAMVAARAREDERLALRLLQSLGYYDATALSSVEQYPKGSLDLRAVISTTPGPLYKLGSVTVVTPSGTPQGVVERELPLFIGDPIEATRVQGAEANVSLKLPQQGYPFVEVGQRDILLDPDTRKGDYTLPVETGPFSRFGWFTVSGRRRAFGSDHVGSLVRFKRGEVYDSRKVDDLREALIATSLFSNVSVEPVRTGIIAPDGAEYVDLRVRQDAGRQRTIAATAGYSTGQGLRLEGSWTHRNLFPPEGALILTGVAGTREQGATATFRRSNAGRRDRTVQIGVAADHNNYEAFDAYTGSLSARVSFDSTPIWQKRWTWFYGAELVGTNEDRYNYNKGARDRGTWLILAAPGFLGYDRSDNLLNPTRGYRAKLNISPETSVRGAARPYVRTMIEGTAYYPVSDSIVIAGRARFGSIQGIARDDLPPSRRYYAGGGGSVRGFGYQELGPRSPDGKPVGGRGLSEFAIEARYRFGDYGIVPFIDAGQVTDRMWPSLEGIRVGAGIGGRFYTNFGPIRVDFATPINRKPGESKLALYISIGQAF